MWRYVNLTFLFFLQNLKKWKKEKVLNLKVLYTDPLFESLFSIVVKVTDPARFSLIHFCIDIIFSHLINSEFQYPFVLPGMTMKGLTFKIKALKQQAVFRFASAYNAKRHDEARAKNPPPHPNKLVSSQTYLKCSLACIDIFFVISH